MSLINVMRSVTTAALRHRRQYIIPMFDKEELENRALCIVEKLCAIALPLVIYGEPSVFAKMLKDRNRAFLLEDITGLGNYGNNYFHFIPTYWERLEVSVQETASLFSAYALNFMEDCLVQLVPGLRISGYTEDEIEDEMDEAGDCLVSWMKDCNIKSKLTISYFNNRYIVDLGTIVCICTQLLPAIISRICAVLNAENSIECSLFFETRQELNDYLVTRDLRCNFTVYSSVSVPPLHRCSVTPFDVIYCTELLVDANEAVRTEAAPRMLVEQRVELSSVLTGTSELDIGDVNVSLIKGKANVLFTTQLESDLLSYVGGRARVKPPTYVSSVRWVRNQPFFLNRNYAGYLCIVVRVLSHYFGIDVARLIVSNIARKRVEETQVYLPITQWPFSPSHLVGKGRNLVAVNHTFGNGSIRFFDPHDCLLEHDGCWRRSSCLVGFHHSVEAGVNVRVTKEVPGYLFIPGLNVGVSVCRVFRSPTTSGDPYCFFSVTFSHDESCFHVYWLNIGNEDGFIASRPFIIGSSSSVVAKVDHSYKEESDVAIFCNGVVSLDGYNPIPRSRVVQEFANDVRVDVRLYQHREVRDSGGMRNGANSPKTVIPLLGEMKARKEAKSKKLCVRCRVHHKTRAKEDNCLKSSNKKKERKERKKTRPGLPLTVSSNSSSGLTGSFPTMNWNNPDLLSTSFN
jgi:hypothetical protein